MANLEDEVKRLKQKVISLYRTVNYLEKNEQVNRLRELVKSNEYTIDLLFEEKTIEERFNFCKNAFEKHDIVFNSQFDYNNLRKYSSWAELELDNFMFSKFKYYLFYLWSFSARLPSMKDYTPICNQFWYFDGERDSHVEYGTFLKRLNTMSGNKYAITDVENIIDPPYGLRFKFEGNQYEWMFKVNNDWTDWDFFKKFTDLFYVGFGTTHEDSNYYSIPEGQGCIFLYLNSQQLHFLESFLGLQSGIKLMGTPFGH